MNRIRLLTLLVAVLSLGLFAVPAHSATVFTAQLNGGNEVANVDTQARGAAIFRLSADGTELHYRLIASNIDDVTMAHIHLAPVGENGAPVVWLYEPDAGDGTHNGVLATGVITEADFINQLAGHDMSHLLELIESGGAYVNVHTVDNPGGEIRGQLH
ncbi:CHRD domain-containing protein [Tessaracoccus lubricantis]|uniref:CHRD domain-containing protein n=1 Tax=Tessaracoccus lubricantis TaxID=545543 RepID=A0ABP9FAC1_9ACTN